MNGENELLDVFLIFLHLLEEAGTGKYAVSYLLVLIICVGVPDRP